MSTSIKLKSGEAFPHINVTLVDDSVITLGKPLSDASWQAIFVYRGKHCPKCTSYLNQLETHKQALADIGIEILAVSADVKEQLQAHLPSLDISFPIAYGLTLAQMQQLGLYISKPRSEQETDHLFPEPGLFIINEQGGIQLTDISNSPHIRPDLNAMVQGLAWIRQPDVNYPIRGTYNY